MAAVCVLLPNSSLEVLMDIIIEYFSSIGLDFYSFVKTALVLLLGTLLVSVLGRFIFGKRSTLSNAVSSAIGILFIYAVTVVLRSSGAKFDQLIAPLPFVSIYGDNLALFSFDGTHYTIICSEILSMIILAFLVNLADGWLPKGKSLLGWIFFRCMTVAVAYLLHLIVVGLFAAYLPQGLVTYAPTVLLWLLVVLILTGALKIIVGALLSTVHPLIGGLYTFFFATAIGRQITKAVLTTVLLLGIVLLLRYIGVTVISIASAALIAYIPFIVLLIALWYLVNHIL